MELTDSEERRKAAAGQLIEKYYYQLTQGCGKKNCDNPHCASSAQSPPHLSPNEAAARAIQCVKVGLVGLAGDQRLIIFLFRPKNLCVLSIQRLRLIRRVVQGRLQRRRRRPWRCVQKEEEECSPLLTVSWRQAPAVSMSRLRLSAPDK